MITNIIKFTKIRKIVYTIFFFCVILDVIIRLHKKYKVYLWKLIVNMAQAMILRR